MSRTRKLLLRLAPAALLVSLVACKGGKAADGDPLEAKKPVIIAPVGRADMEDVLSYVADLKPYAEVRIFSPVPDRILSFPWEEGQEVLRGQQIALIRREGLQKGLEQVVAQIEGLHVQVKNLEDDLGRSKDLLAKGVIPQQTYDKINTSYLSTKAQLKALEASRDQLAVTAGNAVITAPIGGVVAQKQLETGDMAAPQLPLCTIMEIDKLKAELRLIEEDVAKVRLGQKVSLRLDAYPGVTFTGEVTSIMPYLDAATRTNTVEVTVDNPIDEATQKRRIKPGMFGTAEIVVEKKDQVLVAPEPALLLDSALLEQQGRGEVLRKAFVVNDKGDAVERHLKLGVRQGSLYEVLDGLAEGEKLVIRGQHGLKDGQAVEIVSGSAS